MNRPGVLLLTALGSGACAAFLLGYTIAAPRVVGPLFFIALAITCFFCAATSHYFRCWWDTRTPKRD